MEKVLRDKILAVTRRGNTRAQAVDFFRVALGLVYLDGIMTDEEVDFKRLDRRLNRFIYQSIGPGHSITSILQFMSGREALPILRSQQFLVAFSQYCNEVPLERLPDLLAVNLAVARQISGLPIDGALHEWIQSHRDALAGSNPSTAQVLSVASAATSSEPAPANQAETPTAAPTGIAAESTTDPHPTAAPDLV